MTRILRYRAYALRGWLACAVVYALAAHLVIIAADQHGHDAYAGADASRQLCVADGVSDGKSSGQTESRHEHCLLCGASASFDGPVRDVLTIAHVRLAPPAWVADHWHSIAESSLERSGWSSAWSSRAPPFIS